MILKTKEASKYIGVSINTLKTLANNERIKSFKTSGGYMQTLETDLFICMPKIARLSRECTITEKIDGTNGLIYISQDGDFKVGSKSRWITPEQDNHGFARWAYAHKDELMQLGSGYHRGEWWGNGIQRGYGLPNGDKRFSLFNTSVWSNNPNLPKCCSVVPVLYQGIFDTRLIDDLLMRLRDAGSHVVQGFLKPEGVIVYHHAAGVYFKKTIERDESPKG